MAEWPGVAGRQVLITGATSGIGLAGTKELARRGAKLAMVARSEAKGCETAELIQAVGGTDAPAEVLIADLASQASIRSLAAEALDRYPRIDVLINNAGAMFRTRRVSEDGIELTWALNHLAPFLLTTLLLERLKQSAPARVITTASGAHHAARIPFDDMGAEHSYGRSGLARYGQSKLANILFTAELARRLQGTGVTANSFHPGLVASGFNHNNGLVMSAIMLAIKPFSRSPERGAQTLVWLADSPELASESGGYFFDERPATPSAEAQDMQVAGRVWTVSEEQTRTPATSG